MIVGVPREIKSQENRVAIVPGSVRQFIQAGHRVLIESGAGLGSAIPDADYAAEGAEILDNPAEVWSRSDLIMKVKEPLPSEYGYLRPGLILYTYLHLAAVPELGDVLLREKVTAIAYETITGVDGALPLLKPMSEIAGKMAVQVGAHCLEKHQGGRGILLGGVPGTDRAHVVVIGGGVVGSNASKVAVGMGARVTIIDRDLGRLAYLDDVFMGRATTLYSNPAMIERAVRGADLVIGAVLVAGARAPILVPESLVARMKPGAVIVDVAADQGGCIETSRPTTHDDPTYTKHGVVHYCVTNIPGAVSRTSTFALTNATTAYALPIVRHGLDAAVAQIPGLRDGINTHAGLCRHQNVADALNLPYAPFTSA